MFSKLWIVQCILNYLIRVEHMAQRSPSLTVQIDTCPTYEFLLSLCTWNDVDGHSMYEVGQRWFQAIREQAAPDLLSAIEFLKTSYPDDASWQALLRHLLRLDPVETRDRLVVILRRWYDEVFHPQEDQLLPILLRDVESRRLLAATMPAERLIEIVTNGWEYVPEPGIRHVLLIPSIVIRPQVHSLDHHDVKIFCYSVADELLTTDSEAPPDRLLRLVKALSDERRLRILKRLATGQYTPQQLADHFGVGKTLMHHHLIVLRAAGLVYLRGGETRKYSLRHDTIAALAPLLESYLTGKPS